MRLTLLTAISALLVTTLPATAQAQRQIDQYGNGNCIFAPVRLPYNQEGSAPYQRVTQTFIAGQDVYARCYYNGTLEDYKRHGSTYNSLRAEGRYSFNLYWVRPRPDGSLPDNSGLRELTRGGSLNANGSWDWDGQMFIFGKDECDLTVPLYDRELLRPYPNKCLNLANAARYMERKTGISRQARAKFCLRVQLLASDTRRWSFRNDSWRSAPVRDYFPMAGGCFTLDMT